MKLRSFLPLLWRRPAPGTCQKGLWNDHAHLLLPVHTIYIVTHAALQLAVTGSRLQ